MRCDHCKASTSNTDRNFIETTWESHTGKTIQVTNSHCPKNPWLYLFVNRAGQCASIQTNTNNALSDISQCSSFQL